MLQDVADAVELEWGSTLSLPDVDTVIMSAARKEHAAPRPYRWKQADGTTFCPCFNKSFTPSRRRLSNTNTTFAFSRPLSSLDINQVMRPCAPTRFLSLRNADFQVHEREAQART